MRSRKSCRMGARMTGLTGLTGLGLGGMLWWAGVVKGKSLFV